MPLRPPQKPRRLLTQDRGEEQSSRVQKGRCQLHTAQMTQTEPPEAIATKTEQTTQRAKEFKSPVAAHPAWSGPDARSQSMTDENLLPLTARQLTAFQDILKLFSCSPTGTVDMRSMKIALRNVGIQLGPQEMCEALRLADLDGDGIVSFKDFLGVLTDNHYVAQCMREHKTGVAGVGLAWGGGLSSHLFLLSPGQVRNRRVCDPRSLKTLFIEILFKLLNQGFVPSKSTQEVMSYYFKKQRALQLSPGCRDRARGQGRPSRAHAGLNFFCQAARVSGLSNTELARSLHTLCKPSAHSVGRGRGSEARGWGPLERGLFRSHTVPATTSGLRGPTPGTTIPSPFSCRAPAPGARNPYSQIPKLAGRMRPECRTRSRIPPPPTSAFPSPTSPAAPSSCPTWDRSAQVRAGALGWRCRPGAPPEKGWRAGENQDRADGAEAIKQMRRDWRAAGEEWEYTERNGDGVGAGAEGGVTKVGPAKEKGARYPAAGYTLRISELPATPSTCSLRPPAGYVDESLEQIGLSKRALSPATLVQKQPFSPSPTSLQKQAVKNLYK
ncbi:Hypothetical predicted protein [Marmota monax]|uniref:EF-hand domain-containing protein n=1 Tax=Marmota monax TaxID=9995 RepID=A0A5E4BPL6_MARMO|nr:Hypothetical predicted protein [Marmota monax]